jgi:hypothetical protein
MKFSTKELSFMISKRIGLRVSGALILATLAGHGMQAAQAEQQPAPSTAPVPLAPAEPLANAPTARPGSSGSGTAAGQISVPPIPDAQVCPSTTPLSPDSLALLTRVETLVGTALDQKIAAQQKVTATGTVGKGLEGLGRVSVDRADLDEIRADVAQIKVLLQTYIPK